MKDFSNHCPEATGNMMSNDWIKFVFWQDCNHRWWIRWEYGRDGKLRLFRQFEITYIMNVILADIRMKK
ncbi:hypothetical protein [Vibrio sp.]|uniref:hypothetical protein n=1 Tax=Vibrio sp. TaxID=678 RepID=UPI003D111DFC